jgi:hypothetical protein
MEAIELLRIRHSASKLPHLNGLYLQIEPSSAIVGRFQMWSLLGGRADEPRGRLNDERVSAVSPRHGQPVPLA